jgi:hypothetical protein
VAVTDAPFVPIVPVCKSNQQLDAAFAASGDVKYTHRLPAAFTYADEV